MADEGNESRSRRMDLNLYLGLPRSPRPRSLDLGSDLALSSLPLSSSSTTEESRAPVDMSGVLGPSDSHPPYSPSHAAYTPDLPLIDPLHPSDDNINPEYSPFMPSYGPYRPSSYTPISPIARETEGPNAPYSPYVQDLPTVEETEGQVVQDVDSHVPYYPVPPPGMVDELFARDVESHVPYSPSAAFNLQQPIASQTGDFLVRDDGSSSRQDFLQYPEFRFRRLIESHRRLRVRRFRSSLPYGGERSSFGTRPLSTSERVTDALSSARSTETTGNHKVSDDDNGDDELDEEVKGKSKSAADFECNICLDLAKEPVVTSCGHLFCWPCLYQWLHLHGDHKECPVCKGEVIESKVIPIYGRGSSDTSVEKKCREEEGSDLKIPPRPHGHRFESWRQQLQRPLLRPGEGVAASLRRIVNEEMRTRNRAEGDADLSLQGIINDAHRRVLTRLRARRMQREDENPESGSSTGEIGLPRTSTSNPPGSDTSALLRDGIDFLHRFSLYGLTSTDRLAAITADIGRGVGRFASNSNQFGASASSVSPQNPEQLITRAPLGATLAADQASASSTMAVIQGDIAVTGASAEPNRAGSSRSLRRRGRSSTSGSLDVDGGALHARKRRRLN